jgi:hypothetical protein
MSLIELHPDLKETNRQLKRIADALEQFLVEQFGAQVAPLKPSDPADERDVTYADDSETVKREILTDIGKLPKNPEDDDERATGTAKEEEPEPDVPRQSQRPMPTNVTLP